MMEEDFGFAVVGGDRRCAYLAQLLVAERRRVCAVGLELSGLVDAAHISPLDEALSVSDCVILPLPLLDSDGRLFTRYSSEKYDVFSVLSLVNREAVVYAGRIPPYIRDFAKQRGVELHDYYLREELQRLNAVPTAEGAAEILMKRLPVTVAGSRILVLGFGRTAEATALLLKAMGARVTVCARKVEASAHARALGMDGMLLGDLAREHLGFDAVVNTVPARVLTYEVLDRLPRDCFLLDLASAPGGVDAESAKRLGMACECALSLPGTVAPKTAGAIIKDTVLQMLSERGLGTCGE